MPSEDARRMRILALTGEELRLLPTAVRSYLDDFGHKAADVLRGVEQLPARQQA